MSDLQNTAQEVKERLDIVDVIGKYVRLKKMGKNWAGNCPFHSEKTPSFMVNPEIQRYKCYGCGKGGDIFNFIQEIDHLEFPEALERLAKEAGVEVVKRPVNTRFALLEKINLEAADFFHKALLNEEKALIYAHERGLDDETLAQFKIGYSPGRGLLYEHLKAKKYADRVIIDSGLVSNSSGRIKDRFINRLMFPIWNTYGSIVAFSGRQLPGDDFGPKYLNTPETPIFHKSRTVFGLYQNRSEIKKSDLIVLTEGQIDVISAYTAGIRNVVAPLGTALTDDQLDSLGRYSKRLLIIFDNDGAGQKALERAFQMAVSKGFNVYAANTGDKKDLDELIQHSVTDAKKLFTKKIDAYSYILARRMEELDLTDISNARVLVNFHKETLQKVNDPTVRDHLNAKFRKITKLRFEKLDTNISQSSKEVTKGVDSSKTPQINLKDPELYLIALIIKIGEYEKFASINENEITNIRIREIVQIFKNVEGPTLRSVTESSEISEESRKLLVELAMRQDQIPEPKDPNGELNETYMRIQIGNKVKELTNVQRKLAIAEEENDDIKIEELTDKVLKITSQIRKYDDRISRL